MAEVMSWLDGGGDWVEAERGVILSAVRRARLRR
jgi:hypothetical protein